jgi:hypothetical protein
MSYRCEDAPCCGCGPEGCVDRSRLVSCEDCGKDYHPDQNTEMYCYACQASYLDGNQERNYDDDSEYWPENEEDLRDHDYYY